MSTDYKKALLLLKYIIFNFHGFDVEEERILAQTAQEIDGEAELRWVHDFVAVDIVSALDRARPVLAELMGNQDESLRIDLLKKVWNANSHKGHITEMEAMGMLKFAKDWHVERQLIAYIKS